MTLMYSTELIVRLASFQHCSGILRISNSFKYLVVLSVLPVAVFIEVSPLVIGLLSLVKEIT